MEKTFDRNIAGLRWITREITEHNGRLWICLEFQSCQRAIRVKE